MYKLCNKHLNLSQFAGDKIACYFLKTFKMLTGDTS